VTDKPVRLAVIGAGFRGRHSYAAWCSRNPDQAQIVAVADPDQLRRDALGDEHGVAPARRYVGWQALLENDHGLDGVVIATGDREHVGPCVASLAADLDVLLEKPIAPDLEGIEAVRAAANGSSGSVTVAHVLRYSKVVQRLVEALRRGHIGELRGIEHAENIGYAHFAHAYVRGQWRREDLSSPMILAKSCHDLDILRWLAGAPCTSVTSVGGLTHFRQDRAPDGVPVRCLDGCPVEDSCPFHAGRYYLDEYAGSEGWPIPVLTADPSVEARVKALRTGPYGRCVYHCDNDVVDHQVALFVFENGVTATFTVTGFSADNTRTTRLFGTEGELRMDLDRGELTLHRFRPAPHILKPSGTASGPIATDRDLKRSQPVVEDLSVGRLPHHAGGDDGLMGAFISRLLAHRRGERGEQALTSLEEAIESHEMAFAAERSRQEGRTIGLSRSPVAG
jgi:predicted dehydrogenase